MLKTEIKILKVYDLITKCLDKYPAIVSTNPALDAANAQLKINLAQLLSLDSTVVEGAHKRNESAYTPAKKQSRLGLNSIYNEYMGKLGSYLLGNPDDNAPRQFFFTPARVSKANGANLLLGADKIYTYCDSILPSLLLWGIDAASQLSLQTATDAFRDLVDMPYQDKAVRKDKRQDFKTLLGQTRVLVQKNITSYMKAYSITEPSFFTAFSRAKRVGAPGTRLMALRVWVQDAEGKAMEGVVVVVKSLKSNVESLKDLTLNPSPKERDLNPKKEKYKRKTGEKGVANYQHLPYGKVVITVTFPNGDIKTVEAVVKKGVRGEVVVKWE
ncbi:MAG: hypothetical protein NTX03_08040 [Bacteroidetes bacterium]|nr:hypothetical protein [Bacteroidota bacterium]